MAASFETSFQHERDLRGANMDFKRSKDSSVKWSYGQRFGAGVLCDNDTMLPLNGGNSDKIRPWKKRSDAHTPIMKHATAHNINKNRSGSWLNPGPNSRVQTKAKALDEIRETSRSMIDMIPSARKSNVSDDFLYSFDRVDSPARVLSLDVFVKPNARETEKLVEKEYEVLDANGDALKGRKARQTLRKAASSALAAVPDVDDEDFEFV